MKIRAGDLAGGWMLSRLRNDLIKIKKNQRDFRILENILFYANQMDKMKGFDKMKNYIGILIYV